MATPSDSTDLVVDLTQRLDQALRRADLLERRIAAWEKELASVKAELRDFTGQLTVAGQETDRLTGLEQRLNKLESRSLQAAAREALNAPAPRPLEPLKPVLALSPTREDHCALVFARFEPLEAKAGEPVKLRVRCDGFNAGDEVDFVLTEIGRPDAEALPPIRHKLPVDALEEVVVTWTPPKPGKDGHREFMYVARGRGQEARSPVLTVRG